MEQERWEQLGGNRKGGNSRGGNRKGWNSWERKAKR